MLDGKLQDYYSLPGRLEEILEQRERGVDLQTDCQNSKYLVARPQAA
jgi:hypothetical protein